MHPFYKQFFPATSFEDLPSHEDLFFIHRLGALPLRKEPSHRAELLTTVLPLLPMRKLGEPVGDWQQVLLPDGYSGFVERKALELKPLAELHQASISFMQEFRLRNEKIEDFRGIPYLWGGNTKFGMDCSGFIQYWHLLSEGKLLPRDAWMQAQACVLLPYAPENMEIIKKGDLLFMGEETGKYTHIAYSLGAARYIHSSLEVRINSLRLNDGNLFDAYRAGTTQQVGKIDWEKVPNLRESFLLLFN